MKLSFVQGGLVAAVNVREGQRVGRGALLAALDTTQQRAYAAKAAAGLDKAKRDWERARLLYGDSVAPLETMQNARAVLDAATSDNALAEFSSRHAKILAPASGRILKRLVEPNEMIGPGMPAFVFGVQGQGWVVKASVPDQDVVDLQRGDSAICCLDAMPSRAFGGTVRSIADAADPYTGTFDIEIALTSDTPSFRTGMIAAVRLLPRKRLGMLFVPVSAIVAAQGDSAVVYAIAGVDSAYPVPIRIGRVFGDRIAVIGGLERTDEVVAAGAARLGGACRVNRLDKRATP
jgi:RND family efflux transporter MFP subunit